MKIHSYLTSSLLIAASLAAITARADQNLAGNVTVTGGATGNLFVTGYIDSDNNQFTFGTESTSYGVRLLYATGSVPTGANDTLQFLVNRSPASWVWTKNTGTVASPTLTNIMRLDDANRLLLYQSNGTTAGLTLTPASNQISLGTATLTGSGTTLTTGAGLNVAGNFANTGAGNTNSFLGSLGVGTASPANKLHAYGSTGEVALTVDSNGYAPVSLWARNDLDPALYWKANFRMRFGTTTNGISSTGWTERMTIMSNGNVGIGTQSAGTPLDVLKATGDAIQIKTADSNPARLDMGTTGSLWYTTASRTGTGSFLPLTYWTGDNERVRIDTAGNVGIGTTNPGSRLSVNGSASIGGADFPAGTNSLNVYSGGAAGNSGWLRVGQASNIGLEAGWYYNATIANAYAAIGTYGYTNPLRIDASTIALQSQSTGNVGIGTTGPFDKLELGNGTAATGFALYGNASGSKQSWVRAYDKSGQLLGLTIGYGNADKIVLNGAGNTFFNGGNVGIGTSAPGLTLDVNGPVRSTYGSIDVRLQAGAAGAAGVGSFSNDPLLLIAAASEKARITTAGNVGIGTAAPGSRLDVVGDGTNALVINARSRQTNSYLALTTGAADDAAGEFAFERTGANAGNTYIGGNATGNIVFRSGGYTHKMLITPSGNVGIGISSPATKLHVQDANPEIAMGLAADPTAYNRFGFTGGSDPFKSYWAQNATWNGSQWNHVSGAGYNGGAVKLQQYYGTFQIDTAPIGTTTDPIVWNTRFYVANSGNIGVGTTTPTGKLEISQVNAAGWSGNLKAARVVSPDTSYYLDLNTYIIGAGNVGYHFSPNGNTGMVIATTGNVGIGTTNPTHKLAVKGTIRAQEIIVDNTNWADYVFEDSYRLAPLREVEQHIKEKKHLPGIPSTAEVAANGVSMGDMQAKLLSKVEELTLHLIRLEKENNELRQRVQRLEAAP